MTVNDVNWKQQKSFLTLNETERLELEARFVLWVKEVKVCSHEGTCCRNKLLQHVASNIFINSHVTGTYSRDMSQGKDQDLHTHTKM